MLNCTKTLICTYECDSHGLRDTIYDDSCASSVSLTMSYVSSVEDVTCENHGLRETLFLCTTYMTVAVTPLSFSACPMSHQYVGGCDMRQSWSEEDSISM